MGFFGGGDAQAQPALPKIESAPPPAIMPTQKPGKKGSVQATFLGADVVPGAASGNWGGKTLIGL
jgi:hypothetical protein